MQRLSLILVLHILMLAGTIGGLVGPVHAQPAQATDVYSVKFLCGDVPPNAFSPAAHEGPVKPGNYLTAINVHNPNGKVVVLQKKAVLLFRADAPPPPEQPQPPGNLITMDLAPDWGFEIDCTDIRNVLLANAQPPVLAPRFIKGFVVIEVPAQGPTHATPPPPIDVVPVYTGHGFRTETTSTGTVTTVPEGFALEVVRVTPVRKAF